MWVVLVYACVVSLNCSSILDLTVHTLISFLLSKMIIKWRFPLSALDLYRLTLLISISFLEECCITHHYREQKLMPPIGNEVTITLLSSTGNLLALDLKAPQIIRQAIFINYFVKDKLKVWSATNLSSLFEAVRRNWWKQKYVSWSMLMMLSLY